MKPFACDACGDSFRGEGESHRPTLLCDRHVEELRLRKLRLPPGGHTILDPASYQRLSAALATGRRWLEESCPSEHRLLVGRLLDSLERNGLVGSTRGFPHGDPSEAAGLREALDGLCSAAGTHWSASPRTWDHIVYLRV